MPKSTHKIYLDYASSALSESPNPGAIHDLGIREKNKLENARKNIARILSARSSEIIFTSGATESNNLAILGLVPNFKKLHIVTSNIEHASVLEVCRHLEKNKMASVTYVPVEPNGIIDPKKIKKALTRDTALVSIMYANNEIGTIQPIGDIAKEVRHFNKINNTRIFLHTDAVQAMNYLPVNVAKLGVDMMSFNAAKIYGPKGVGALYVRKNTPLKKIMFGGDQEMGLRPGTENVAGAMALKTALEITEKIKIKESARLVKLRDYFLDQLENKLKRYSIVTNGDLKNRLSNNINITVPNIPSDLLVIELSARGIMTSAKSACKAGDGKVSHVVKAINKNIKETDGSVRFSLGRHTTKKDIENTIKELSQILNKLEKWYN